MDTRTKTVTKLAIVKHEVGDKVIFVVQYNNPGQMTPNERIEATVIAVFEGPTQPRTYKLELERTWTERMPAVAGKKIIVGNVSSDWVFPCT